MKWVTKVFIKWIIIYLLLIILDFLFPLTRSTLFLIMGTGFLIGFVLRFLHKYPGKEEPLFLDGWGGLSSFIFAFLTPGLPFSIMPIFYLLPLLPHFLYLFYLLR